MKLNLSPWSQNCLFYKWPSFILIAYSLSEILHAPLVFLYQRYIQGVFWLSLRQKYYSYLCITHRLDATEAPIPSLVGIYWAQHVLWKACWVLLCFLSAACVFALSFSYSDYISLLLKTSKMKLRASFNEVVSKFITVCSTRLHLSKCATSNQNPSWGNTCHLKVQYVRIGHL